LQPVKILRLGTLSIKNRDLKKHAIVIEEFAKVMGFNYSMNFEIRTHVSDKPYHPLKKPWDIQSIPVTYQKLKILPTFKTNSFPTFLL
jgi:hypothetical protein